MISYKVYNYDYELETQGEDIILEEKQTGIYIGSWLHIAELEAGIAGMTEGETRKIYVDVPTNFEQEAIAGKSVVFDVTLNSVYEPSAYDNAFVKMHFEYDNKFDFEEYLKNEYVLTKLYEYFAEEIIIKSYPEKEYNEKVEKLRKTEDSFFDSNGITLDEYIMQTHSMTREEYIKYEMKREMLFYSLAQAENIAITSEMIENERTSLELYYQEQYLEKDSNLTKEQALTKAKSFVTALGYYYLYENVVFEQVDGMLPKQVETEEKAKTYKSITYTLLEREECPSYKLEQIEGEGLNGVMHDPSSNLGEITILNFWGTWCEPCKKELPDFDRIATEYADELTIYAIHSNQGFNRKACKYISDNYGESNMIFLKDVLSNPDDLYSDEVYFKMAGGENGYPYTVILNEKGQVIFSHEGRLTYSELVKILNTYAGLELTE